MNKEDLLRLAAESKESDLSVLITAKEEAKQNVLDNKSKATLEAFEKASKMLDDYLAREQQGKDPASISQPLMHYTFTETKQQTGPGSVLAQLQKAGYQIEKTKLNRDVKDGKLARDKGFFTPARIRKYADLLPRTETGMTDNDYQAGLAKERLELENERKRIINKQLLRKEDQAIGRLVPRDDFERELAARFVVLYSDATRMAQSQAPEFVHLVGGDLKKSDDLTAALIAAMDVMLQQYATTKKFHVLIVPNKKEPR